MRKKMVLLKDHTSSLRSTTFLSLASHRSKTYTTSIDCLLFADLRDNNKNLYLQRPIMSSIIFEIQNWRSWNFNWSTWNLGYWNLQSLSLDYRILELFYTPFNICAVHTTFTIHLRNSREDIFWFFTFRKWKTNNKTWFN